MATCISSTFCYLFDYDNCCSSARTIAGLRSEPISFEPRLAGPISIFGPAVSLFGDSPLALSHISSTSLAEGSISFVTWNDNTRGEYQLWQIVEKDNTFYYHCFPQLVHSVWDQQWLDVWFSISLSAPLLSYF